jgi:formamidopyrimidine-DNA glycosylase
MPELPEVETIRRLLAPLLSGRTILGAEVFDPRLVLPLAPAEMERGIEGQRLVALERRGKYLLFRFEGGLSLLAHLRMTGSFRYLATEPHAPAPHRRALFRFDDGAELEYRDLRRFGTWRLLEREQLESYLAERVGPEPLSPDFTVEFLRERLRGRRAPLKAALLDQRTVAGLGNIYCDEALWLARLHPARPAGSLGRRALVRLHDSIRAALEQGIARQGASVRDYALPSGERGSMQEELRVYGRAGERCQRCGTAIAKTRVAGRGTWYCPHCQRRRDRATDDWKR